MDVRAIHYKEAEILRLYKIKKLNFLFMVVVFNMRNSDWLYNVDDKDLEDSSLVKLEYDFIGKSGIMPFLL